MSNINDDLDKTRFLLKEDEADAAAKDRADQPLLFVCQGKSISEHRLEGRQEFGRPVDGARPEICVFNRFVSRQHGVFETEQGVTRYTALKTTNPTMYKGAPLKPGEQIVLRDGDELVITYVTENGEGTLVLIAASSSSRINLWRDLELASRDELTSLYGREGFSEWWLENRDGPDYRQAALFILDVDDFKMINDQNGHNAGDVVLKEVAGELRKTVRYDNQICRWGGDEFVGVIPGDRERVEDRLEDLCRRISAISVINSLPVTASIGYLCLDGDRSHSDLDTLVEKADKAMYRAKKQGKNCVFGY